jgi:O-antigen ligase
VSAVGGLRKSTVGLAVFGAALFVTAAAWAVVTATAAHSSPAPTVALILASAQTLAVCWLVASRWPTLIPAGLVGAALALVVADVDGTFSAEPLQGPFGYANAKGAFFAQAIVAALMLAVGARVATLRSLGIVAAVVFASLVIMSRSWTAALVLPLVVMALAVERARNGRTAVIVCGALFGFVLLATVALGARGVGDGTIDRVVGATLSTERVQLWHEALAIAADEPILGVGPGRFASTSPTAFSDIDLRWAHNEFLQSGAESGLPGFVFVVGLFTWGFAALWATSSGPFTALAAAGLALLGIHASVDYVLHFPAVALTAAAVLGTGLGIQQGRSGQLPVEPVTVPVWEPV